MSSNDNIKNLIKLYKEVLEVSKTKGEAYRLKKINLKVKTVSENINELKTSLNDTVKSRKLIDDLQRKYYQIVLNTKEKEELFLISVIGEEKSGKSTLIDVFLGANQTKIDYQPKICRTNLYYGSDENDIIKIIKKDSSFIEKNIQETNEIIKKEEEKYINSEQEVINKIQKLKKTIYNEKEKKERIEKEKKENIYKSDIVELQIPVRINEMLKSFRLLDTPTITETICGDVKNRINEYYGRANGLIWLLDANKIENQDFDENLLKLSLEKIGGVKSNIIAVLNKIDIVKDKDKIDDILENIYKKYFDKIIPISAKKAYEGITTNNKELIDESNINELIIEINSKFKEDKDNIKLSSNEYNYERIMKECLSLLEKYKNELVEKNNERIEKNNYLKKKIERSKIRFKYQIKKIVQNYIKDVNKRISYRSEKIIEINTSKEKKEYIESEIIKLDELIDVLHKYEKEIEKEYIDLYNFLLRKSCFKEYQYIRINAFDQKYNTNILKKGEDDYNFDIECISFMSNIEMLNVKDSFLRNVELSLRYFMENLPADKTWEKKTYLNILKNNLKVAIHNIGAKVEKEAKDIIIMKMDEMGENCYQLTEDTFEKIYCSSKEIDKNLEIINRLYENVNKDVEGVTIEEIILNKVKI